MFTYFKRRYYDLRMSWSLIAPLFAYSNFILILYNFTGLKDSIEVEYFIIFFTIGFSIIALLVGKMFRIKQLETDINLGYEQSTEHVKSTRIQLEATKIILEKLDVTIPDELEKRLKYFDDIEQRKL